MAGNYSEKVKALKWGQSVRTIQLSYNAQFKDGFIVSIGGDRIYYLVAARILDSSAFVREIAPLKKVSDHYPQFILSMDEIPMSEDGIEHKRERKYYRLNLCSL